MNSYTALCSTTTHVFDVTKLRDISTRSRSSNHLTSLSSPLSLLYNHISAQTARLFHLICRQQVKIFFWTTFRKCRVGSRLSTFSTRRIYRSFKTWKTRIEDYKQCLVPTETKESTNLNFKLVRTRTKIFAKHRRNHRIQWFQFVAVKQY